jgi:hypothetical protein
MWRDEVLFIRQRQQATSDYRENKNIRWIGALLFECCKNAKFRVICEHVSIVRKSWGNVGHFEIYQCIAMVAKELCLQFFIFSGSLSHFFAQEQGTYSKLLVHQ